MNNRRIPLTDDQPKHKKKSKAKGLPRADHKHQYETVLLTQFFHTTEFKTGKPKTVEIVTPTTVCTICGRIGYTNTDPKYYKDNKRVYPFGATSNALSEEALALPYWYADFFDKFAYKNEKGE